MSQRPLPYCGSSSGLERGSLYERKMKWWIGLLSVGLTAKRARKTSRMASGSTQVCLTAMLLARRRAVRAFLRFEKRFEGVAGPVADS